MVRLMPITLVNPAGLPVIDAYKQVSVSTGSRLVHVAGQVAWDADGAHVGVGDLATQVEVAYRNLATALAGVGATVQDLAKVTVYVVDWTPDQMPLLIEGLGRAMAALGAAPTPPATLIGVATLDVPEHLVEIEAVAVLD